MRKIISALILIIAISVGSAYAGGSKKVMLKNGITFIENKRDYTNTVAVYVMIKGGLYLEDNSTNGIGYLTSRVQLKSNKILEAAEFYGASVSVSPTPYSTEISLSSPTDVFNKLLPDFEQFILAPKFNKDIFKREQKAVIEEIISNKDDPNTIAYERFAELAYAGTPYAMTTSGKIENIEKLTLDDLPKFYKHMLEDSQIIVSVTGNFNDKMIKDLQATFSKIKTAGKFDYAKYADVKSVKFESKRAEEVDTRIKQSKIYMGVLAPAADDKLFDATVVLSEILGGGMSSRYFTEIRKNLGFAYTISSGYPARVGRSVFLIYAGLEYDNIPKAIESLDEINKNLAKTLTDAEVEKGKNSVLGSLLMQSQTNSSIAKKTAFYELIGLGSSYADKSIEQIKALTKKDILKAAEILGKDRVIFILKPAN